MYLPFVYEMKRETNTILWVVLGTNQMEREADYIGMQLMAKACFDPHEMPKVRSIGTKLSLCLYTSFPRLVFARPTLHM